MPRAVADVARKDVAAETAEALTVDNVEPAANLKSGRQRETQHGGEGIRSPRRNLVEPDGSGLARLDAIGENVDLVFPREPCGQLSHIAAVPAGPVVVVHHVSDSHRMAHVTEFTVCGPRIMENPGDAGYQANRLTAQVRRPTDFLILYALAARQSTATFRAARSTGWAKGC